MSYRQKVPTTSHFQYHGFHLVIFNIMRLGIWNKYFGKQSI